MARRGAGAGEGEHARGEDRVRRMRNHALVTGVFTILSVKLMLQANNLNNLKIKRTGHVQAGAGPAGGGAAGSLAGDWPRPVFLESLLEIKKVEPFSLSGKFPGN